MANDPRFPPVRFIDNLDPYGHPQYIPGNSAQQRPPSGTRDNSAPTASGFDRQAIAPNALNSFPVLNNTPGGGNAPPGTLIAPPSVSPVAGSMDPVSMRDLHHYAQVIGLNFSIATTSAKFLDQPPTRRNLLMLRNNSATANIYIDFGKDATTNSTLRITPNTVILFDTVVPQDDLYAIADAASAFLSVSFSTIL